MTTIVMPAQLPGVHTDRYGPTVVTYRDGVAVVDDLPPAVRSFLLGRGYTVDGVQTVTPETTEPAYQAPVQGVSRQALSPRTGNPPALPPAVPPTASTNHS